MSNAQVQYQNRITQRTQDGIISVERIPYIMENGIQRFIGPRKSMGFVPGDFQSVSRFAPELLPEFNKIWTPEIVYAFRERQRLIEESIDNPKPESLEEAKRMKKTQIDLACEDALAGGFHVPELDLYFTLDLYDQVSLSGLSLLATHSEYVPFYYGTEDDCRVFTAEEFFIITTHATIFATYHRTHRKQLRRMIADFTEIDKVMDIYYGMELTGRYLKRMKEIMAVFNPSTNPLFKGVKMNAEFTKLTK